MLRFAHAFLERVVQRGEPAAVAFRAFVRLARAVAVVARDGVFVRHLGGDEAGARAASHQGFVQALRFAQVAQRGGGVAQALADVGGDLQQAHARVRRVLELDDGRLGDAGLDDVARVLVVSQRHQVAGARTGVVGLAVVVREHRGHPAVQPGARPLEVAGAQVDDGHQRRVVGEHARRHAVFGAPYAFEHDGALRAQAQAVVALGEVEDRHREGGPRAGGLGQVQPLFRQPLRLGQVPQIGMAATQVDQRVDVRPRRLAGLGGMQGLVKVEQRPVVLAEQLVRDGARVVADVEIGGAARDVGARGDAHVQLERVVQLTLRMQARGVELVAHQQAACVVVGGEGGARQLVGLDGRGDAARTQQCEADVEVRLAAQRERGLVLRGVQRGLAERAGAAAVDVELPVGLLQQPPRIVVRSGQVRGGRGKGVQGSNGTGRCPPVWGASLPASTVPRRS